MSHAIVTEGLVKRFGTTKAVDGVDLQVPTGRILGLLGPNGAGKTTMVRILATLLRPDAGRARVGGFDVESQAHQVRQLIALTGQYASVDGKLTGRENLILVGRLLGLSRIASRRRAEELLETFALGDAAGRAAQTYSGGMKRRLDLAASLVAHPRILFLDEPTTGLDPRARKDLWQLIRQRAHGGTTVLLTTQYMEEADHLAEEIVVMDSGRIIASGTPDQLKARVATRSLLVRAVKASDVARIQRVLGEVSEDTPEVRKLEVTVGCPDSSMLRSLMRRLDEAKIEVDELILRTATLDDVFLALTGRPLESTRTEEPPTEATIQ